MFCNTKKDAVVICSPTYEAMLYFLLGSSCRDDGDSQQSRWEKELMKVCDGMIEHYQYIWNCCNDFFLSTSTVEASLEMREPAECI